MHKYANLEMPPSPPTIPLSQKILNIAHYQLAKLANMLA